MAEESHTVKFNIGNLWENTDKMCPVCSESQMRRNKLSNPVAYRCFTCGYEVAEKIGGSDEDV